MLRPHHLLEEPFRRGNIAFSTEHELDRLPLLVHGSIEILKRLPDLDVRLVDTEGRAAHLQMRSDALVNFGRVSLDPTKNSRVIYFESALAHHLFDVTVRELVATVPPDAQKYYGRLEVTPLERGFILLQGYDSRSGLTELKV